MRILSGVLAGLIALSSLTVAEKKFPAAGNPILFEVSKDPKYGLTEKNPRIKVGQKNGGPKDERMYLMSLRGPQGQTLQFKR